MGLINAVNVTIANNSFQNIGYSQLGSQEGAGIFISSLARVITIVNNTFRKCEASIGGAIRWTNFFPYF